MFLPEIDIPAAAGTVLLQGTPINVATGVSLAGVVAFNRSGPQLENANIGASGATGQLVTNTTTTSRAWVYANVAGNTFSLNAPLAQAASPWATQTPAEVAWANTNLVNLSTLTKLNVVSIGATVNTYNTTNTVPFLVVDQLDFFDPLSATDSGLAPVSVGSNVQVFESLFERVVNVSTAADFGDIFTNCNITNGIGGGTSGRGISKAVGGLYQGVLTAPFNMALDGDIIVNSTFASIVGDGRARFGGATYGTVYLDTGTTLVAGGTVGSQSNYNTSTPIVWGPGTFNARGRVAYPSGAGLGASTFLVTTLQINSQTLACKGQPGAGGITIACNASLNAALLDTNAGATSGCTFVAGGGSFCNYGP